ncbi:MAG TPA: L-histidine N(alpha)-methyltransferase [Thermoanaerobaculia bacterium]|nr:L-histidine N(alpha)-methyltransferase [Thermoanaerobaculia bacterium]
MTQTQLALAPDLLAEVLAGLGARPKSLPSKLFYDEAGCVLFERICELPEYYLTRTELGLLERHGGEMAAAVGADGVVVELGSGSGRKTRLLLDQLVSPRAYVPVDLASEELQRTAQDLGQRYPGLAVLPLEADFTADFALPTGLPAGRRIAYFPGSTIGNLGLAASRALFGRLASFADGLLLGFDLKKEPVRLHAAYNDAAGVTAAFNKNLLARLNREAGADFDLGAFDHYAPYDPIEGRIEMYLVARRDQVVRLAGQSIAFAQGEALLTEWSHKYSVAQMEALTGRAGWRLERLWTDDERLFAVGYFMLN